MCFTKNCINYHIRLVTSPDSINEEEAAEIQATPVAAALKKC